MNISVFESPEFAPTQSASPFAQILNPKLGGAVGFAVTEKNAIAAGLSLPSTWEKTTHEFGSGDEETVYVTKTPRLLVLGGSALIMRDRETRKTISKFNNFTYNKTEHSLYRRMWCYILNESNGFCHAEPLAIAIGGASGASFMSTWLTIKPRGGFIDKMEALYAAATNKPKANKGELFHAHCVYEPILEVQSRGVQKTSKVTVTTGFKEPSIEKNLLIDDDAREFIAIAHKQVKVLAAEFEARVLNQSAGNDMLEDQPF
jgi:hypothetical protein